MNEPEVIVFSTLLALKGRRAMRASIRVALEEDGAARVKAFARAVGQGPTTPFIADLQSRVGLLQCFVAKISGRQNPGENQN